MARPLKVKKLHADDPIEVAAERILRTRLKEFYSHWPDHEQDPTGVQLHNLRISGKRLRYAAETLSELYPDRLGFLIDLLKRNQDLLGEIQDCVTQRAIIEDDLKRLKRRRPGSEHIAVFERMISDYDQRRLSLFNQFREIWQGMARDDFRKCLKNMISKKS